MECSIGIPFLGHPVGNTESSLSRMEKARAVPAITGGDPATIGARRTEKRRKWPHPNKERNTAPGPVRNQTFDRGNGATICPELGQQKTEKERFSSEKRKSSVYHHGMVSVLKGARSV